MQRSRWASAAGRRRPDLTVVDEVDEQAAMPRARASELDHEAFALTSSLPARGRRPEPAIALELVAQPAQRVVESRLHGAELDAEHLGRLLERQAVEVIEDDDAAVLLRQGRDAVADDRRSSACSARSAGSGASSA